MPLLIQGDARCLPLPDASVDLIVTSPPYWSLRSYSDGGKHYDGQIGSEHDWRVYLDVLMDCAREWSRVLKPTGSMWINLGDKYVANRRGPNGQSSTLTNGAQYRHRATPSTVRGAPDKSLLLLPHRLAIRLIDELGLIVRMDQVWSKVNGLPESVKDRTRRTHEYLFHVVKQPSYYEAIDEIRLPHDPDTMRPTKEGRGRAFNARNASLYRASQRPYEGPNPLGAVPGSVWEVATQPLDVPDHIVHARCCGGDKRPGCQDGLDHYAAFPMDLVRPVILGWSPRQVCTRCGQGRRPVVKGEYHKLWNHTPKKTAANRDNNLESFSAKGRGYVVRTIMGYSCDCATPDARTTPGVVLDPFGGTGTAALVAAMTGRLGISVDRSWDYCDLLARWRINDPKERARAAGLEPDAVARIPQVHPEQGSLLDLLVGSP